MSHFFSTLDINSVILAVGAVAIMVNQVRGSKLQGFKDTIADKDLTITRLETQIATNKAEASNSLAMVKAKAESDIASLKTEVQHLKEANIILQNTVTGKETLEAIMKRLDPVPAFFSPGGALEGFMKADAILIENDKELMRQNKLIIEELSDIKKKNHLDKRDKDHVS